MTNEEIAKLLEPLSRSEQLRLLTDHFCALTDRQRLEYEYDRIQVEAVLKFAEIAIRSLLLLCGGAAIALLAFAGNASKETTTSSAQLVAYGKAVSVLGVAAACSVVTAGASYLSQSAYRQSSQGWHTVGRLFQMMAILLWLFGVGMFGFGIWVFSSTLDGAITNPSTTNVWAV